VIRRPARAVTPLVAVAVAVAVLLLPGAALADVPAGTWRITGLVLDGTKIDASGTIGFSGSGFGASVGCNSIGGAASVSGDGVLTFSGDLTTTLIGCPGLQAEAEGALMKILSAGPITLGEDKWTSAAGEIDVVALDTADPGCIPPVAPGANPGNVTVPCGNGGVPGPGENGSTFEATPPTNGPDPLLLAGLAGMVLLIVATIGAFIYLGPRRGSAAGE
jgi:META domain-containing protein